MGIPFHEIRRLLPQSYPFFFVDRVVELEKGQKILAVKNVSANEPYFQGHFRDVAVMPGALIMEALAQASILLFRLSDDEFGSGDGQVFVVGGVRARFERAVFPGDTLELHVEVEKLVTNQAIVKAEARVDGERVTSATLTFSAADADMLHQQRS